MMDPSSGRRWRRWMAVALMVMAGSTATSLARGDGLSDMTGCWISDGFDATSLLADSADPKSAQLLHEKMLLEFDTIAGTEFLVFGYIFEWDRDGTYVLGPTYQNGAYNPALGFLIFGFPDGGLDHVTQSVPNKLLYVHSKSADKSAMSVRRLSRIDCKEAAKQRTELLARQEALN